MVGDLFSRFSCDRPPPFCAAKVSCLYVHLYFPVPPSSLAILAVPFGEHREVARPCQLERQTGSIIDAMNALVPLEEAGLSSPPPPPLPSPPSPLPSFCRSGVSHTNTVAKFVKGFQSITLLRFRPPWLPNPTSRGRPPVSSFLVERRMKGRETSPVAALSKHSGSHPVKLGKISRVLRAVHATRACICGGASLTSGFVQEGAVIDLRTA